MSTRFTCAASLLAPIALAAAAGVAHAAPVVFPPSSGGNGNSYELIADPALDRHGAAGAAALAGGALVSITSAAEQAFVESLLIGAGAPTGSYWTSLQRTPDGSTYFWTTGEPYAYQNFAPGEPNDYEDVEIAGQIYWTQDPVADVNARRGWWNDVPLSGYPLTDIPDLVRAGYIIERAGPGGSVIPDPVIPDPVIPPDDTDGGTGGGTGGGDDGPPVAIPLPPAVFAAPLAFALAGMVGRRRRRVM